jgi:hypothetical protein
VTPATVTSVAQTLPLLSNAKSNSSPEGQTENASPNSGAVLNKDSALALVDTVSISPQSRQAITDVKKEETKKEQAKNEEPKRAIRSEKSDEAIAKVQFVYNMKGDLAMRYLDASSRVVYQVPSEFMQRLQETVLKSDSSVDTKA